MPAPRGAASDGSTTRASLRVVNVLFEGRYGGPHRRVLQVATGLAGRGVETIVCLPGGGNGAAAVMRADVPVRLATFERPPSPRSPRRIARWIALFARDVATFTALYRVERPDVVHVNGALFIAPAVAARRCRIPFVWHFNDLRPPRWLAVMLGRMASALAGRVVVSSQAVATHHGLAPDSCVTIYPPVELPSGSGIDARRPDVARIGVVANWTPIKGFEYYLRAAARVREQWPGDFEVVIAGARLDSQAAYSRRIDDLIDELGLRPCMRDLGFVQDVPALIASLDVLVHPALSEAFGMSVLEAMALGVPVVTSTVGGLPELVGTDQAERAGLLVAPRDAEATARAILELLKDPSTARRLGDNGRRRAQTYAVETCVDRHLAVYRDAVRPRQMADAS